MDGKLEAIHGDLRTLEGWVENIIDNLEERVTSAFATHQDMIDNVEDRVDEMQKTHKEHKEESDEHFKKHNKAIKELKKAIEDMRGEGEAGAIQSARPGARTSQGGSAAPFQKRLRIGGWSPYGSPSGSRISETEAIELQKKISSYFTRDQKAAWRWDRPWLTNFQMIIHVDYAADPSDVFKAKSDIQAI